MNSKLSIQDVDRVINMAWEDRTPFEAILWQFGLSEAQVIELMRKELKDSSFKRWRARVQSRKTKHLMKRSTEVLRFKSKAQRHISSFRISKKKY